MGKGSTPAGRLVTAGVLALTSAGGLTAALLVAGVGPASASSATITYSCSLSGLLTFAVPVALSASAPSSVTAGGTATLTSVSASATLPASTISTLLGVIGPVKSIGGNITGLDFSVTGGSPTSVNTAATPIAFTTPVKKGSPATLTVSGQPVSATAGSSGTVAFTPGQIIITTQVPKFGTVKVTCTQPAGVAVLASVPVSSSGGGSTTPSSTPAPVPATHTGEPWAGWPYWALVVLLGFGGLLSLELAVRSRRRRA